MDRKAVGVLIQSVLRHKRLSINDKEIENIHHALKKDRKKKKKQRRRRDMEQGQFRDDGSSSSHSLGHRTLQGIMNDTGVDYIIEQSLEQVSGCLRMHQPAGALKATVDLIQYITQLQLGNAPLKHYVCSRLRSEIESFMEHSTEEGDSMPTSELAHVLSQLEDMSLVTHDEDMPDPSNTVAYSQAHEMEDIVESDGSTVECTHCGSVISSRRMAIHLQFWCQALHK